MFLNLTVRYLEIGVAVGALLAAVSLMRGRPLGAAWSFVASLTLWPCAVAGIVQARPGLFAAAVAAALIPTALI